MNLSQLKKMNRWRDGFNPLRGLTIMQAVSLLEAGERGEYAALQWLYRAVERRNATLRAVKSRRLSAITKLDWNIRVIDPELQQPESPLSRGVARSDGVCASPLSNFKSEINKSGEHREPASGCSVTLPRLLPPVSSLPLAKRQSAVLQEAYNRLDNLREAIAFLLLAEFRGYAHLEKHYDVDGSIVHLEPVPQWLLFRKGLYGAWQYNAEARTGAPREEDPLLDLNDFLVHEVDDPINEIAVLAHLRQSLSQKDWDGFIETYGIPPLFIELPPNVPADKEALYQAQAEAIIGDARGTMPHGAKIQTVTPSLSGGVPFSEHIRYQDECIVLAGTGGKLTMLAESGTGSLAGGAHQNTFEEIARADALVISEVFQKQFDAAVLAEKFPGAPVLAYFELTDKK